jgi:hypothetical protein
MKLINECVQDSASRVSHAETRRRFRKLFKRDLNECVNLKVPVDTAFGIVWHNLSQAVGLAERDSSEIFQEMILWAKKRWQIRDNQRPQVRVIRKLVIQFDADALNESRQSDPAPKAA